MTAKKKTGEGATEKRIDKAKDPDVLKGKSAVFVSSYAELSLQIVPQKVIRYSDGSVELPNDPSDPSYGVTVQFHAGTFEIPALGPFVQDSGHKTKVKNADILQRLKNHESFGSLFMPDPLDRGGYWEATGYYKRGKPVSPLVRAGETTEIDEARESLEGVAGQQQDAPDLEKSEPKGPVDRRVVEALENQGFTIPE